MSLLQKRTYLLIYLLGLRAFQCFRQKFHGIWSTMALYMFNLHIPLGIGGLSIVAYALHRPVLDPQTEAVSLIVIQLVQLIGALLLLKSNAKPEYKVERFFGDNKLSKERNWLLASLLGFGFLWLLVFLTSFLADRINGPKVGLLSF